MANKIKVKLILELREAHMSQRAIAATRHMSRSSVSDVFRIANEKSICYSDVRDMTEDEVYQLFYPAKHPDLEQMYCLPDYSGVHAELRKVGVTLKLLWQEYQAECRGKGALPVGYSKYCDDYARYVQAMALTNHLIHKPGARCEVDWSGPTMKYVDTDTGEVRKVYLFVATLPYSQYSYVEPCLDMKQNTWLQCHVNMYQFFHGVPVRTICDNLKTGVIKHPKEGDIVLNSAYEELGNHYCTAIMPTGIKKPKQKASVEGTVGKIATAIIAKLRNETFESFGGLKSAVGNALAEFNTALFQKREGSRHLIWLEEKSYLRGLPHMPYEICEWKHSVKVYPNSHIVFRKNNYSCPYHYCGREVSVKVTDTLLEIYHNHERIATHAKFPEYRTNAWSTHKEDMPDEYNQPEWDDRRIKLWAASIGENTAEVIDRIFRGVNIKEQAYNSSLSVLKLAKAYSDRRLEVACEVAMKSIQVPRYQHLKAILSGNQDIIYLEQKQGQMLREKNSYAGGYIRGARYYGGRDNDK
jgi:transposase